MFNNPLPLDNPSKVLEFLAYPSQVKTYLELGVRCGKTFMSVSKCVDAAFAVDITFRELNIRRSDNMCFYEMSTDDFFKQNTNKFDLIFIDALHEYEQIKTDLLNSIKVLNENGFIALHDVDPLRENLKVPEFCGDAYKILKYIDERLKDYQFTVVHYDEVGIAILQKN